MTEDVRERHPDLTEDRREEWRLMADAFNGESAIKARGKAYLPMPSGFNALSDSDEAYNAYRGRAQFPEILAPSVSAMVGIAHGKEITIEMPDALGYLWENATGSSTPLPLEAFHRRITRNLLVRGRFGVLADAPETGGNPFLAGYTAPSIINWDENFWVLDESGMIRTGFKWELHERYRVLELIDGRYTQTVYDGEQMAMAESYEPKSLGGQVLDLVPFAVANARDIVPEIETPPLIGVARAAKSMYQLSADYRHQLYMSGQETLVGINGDVPEYVGAGVAHSMHGTEGITPDLKYVGPSCAGIEAHKQAIQDERESAVMAGARMIEQSDSVQESGEARELRFASETASLKSVVMASCGLLEKSLKHCAIIQGQDPDAVVVTPPDDLMEKTLAPGEAEALVRVWQSGAMSYDQLFENLQRGGLINPDATAEEELRRIDDAEFREETPI